jgi:hypothetical protein
MAKFNYDFDILPNEVFVIIQGFENYSISNFGRIISTTQSKPKLLSPQTDAMGYSHYRLYNRTETDEVNVTLFKGHRLVAAYFVPKPKVKGNINLEVNHIDGDKSNNHFSNLEWVTRSENLKHAIRTGLKYKFHTQSPNRRPVELFKHGVSVGKFDSITDAAAFIKMSPLNITNWITKGRKSRYGYTAVDLPKDALYTRIKTKAPALPSTSPLNNQI